MTHADLAAVPHGSLRLLDTPLAQTVLAAAVPARVAYTARDGRPRTPARWF